MNLARVSANGQITVPVEIRRALKLREGDKSSCSVSSGKHYVVDDAYYQEDMPFRTDRFPAGCKLAFEA